MFGCLTGKPLAIAHGALQRVQSVASRDAALALAIVRALELFDAIVGAIRLEAGAVWFWPHQPSVNVWQGDRLDHHRS